MRGGKQVGEVWMKLATAVRSRVGEGAKAVSDDVLHPGGY